MAILKNHACLFNKDIHPEELSGLKPAHKLKTINIIETSFSHHITISPLKIMGRSELDKISGLCTKKCLAASCDTGSIHRVWKKVWFLQIIYCKRF